MANSKWMRRIKHMHFIGIGGSGMSGLAEVYYNEGYEVSGSDVAESPVTQRLSEEGITVYIGHEAKNLENVDVVVVSSAIDKDNIEIKTAREKRLPIVPRAEMLAELMRFRRGIAIAGTHGKTTTTSLVASILAEADLDPTYVIGGRLNSSGAHAKLGDGHYLVAEADESDASFLHLQPLMAIVTNIDLDHMTTYGGDPEKLYDTFVEFLYQLPFYGLAILCRDDSGIQKILERVTCPVLTYGIDSDADVKAYDIQQDETKMSFKVKRWGQHPELSIILNLPGRHNVLNALSAIIVATELNIADQAICKALREFSGVGRRFQQLGQAQFTHGTANLIDDYGHHPREVEVTIAAIRGAWPNKRLVMVYQPHRYTRTHDLFNDFVSILNQVDVLLMLDVYSAGEDLIEGATTTSLCQHIEGLGKIKPIHVQDKLTLTQALDDIVREGDVLLLQGAGDIGKLAKSLYADRQKI